MRRHDVTLRRDVATSRSRSRSSKFFRPAQRYDDFKLIRLKKKHQNCCRLHCRCHHLGYSVPPAHLCTIWYPSTFGPRGPGLSNPTSFLSPAFPMAPTTDDNARDKRSVLRPNPATFLSDFTLYMTTNYAIIRKYYEKIIRKYYKKTHLCLRSFIKDARFRLKLQKKVWPMWVKLVRRDI